MSNYLKEAIWLFTPIILSLLLTIFFFGTNAYTNDVIDINIHATYFIIAPWSFTLLVAVFLGFFISLFRAIILRFKNKISNYIFLFYTILLIAIILPMAINNNIKL